MTEPATDILDGYVIVGNHIHHGPLREGARCYVSHWSALREVEVLVAPKGRKWARFWTRIDRLYDIRLARECAPKGSQLGWLLRPKEEQEATMAKLLKERASQIARRATV